MKKLYLFLFLGLFSALSSQNKILDTTNYLRNGMFENAQGKIITNSSEKIQFQKERNHKIELEKSHLHKGSATAVEMCTNGGFEQVETINGKNFIKNFLYNIGDPPGPTQCKSISNSAVSSIPQYSPTANNLMATSVPANLFDRYMGDIKAFDQYALKINYENSGTYGSIVQGQRFKTNNENFLKFNYKAILQSVYDDSHRDNQPFFKARIINKDKVVVSEFCLVGDEKNCIFTKVSDGGSWYVTLYTANWQSGILDISSIPNNEEFTVEFMASRCGLGGHFGYAYVDDICLLQSNENFVGSVTLDPLYSVCPTAPITICGNYTLPNSGGVTATLKKLTLKVYNENGQVVHTTTTTSSLDPVTKKFCFTLLPQVLPNISTSNYNVGVTADFDVGTSGTGGSGCGNSGNTQIFASASDPDANDGWDISFLNCSTSCDIVVKTAKISKCDTDRDGKEDFNLTNFDALIVNSTTGLTFNYFKDYTSAFNNSGAIPNFTAYNSASAIVYVRVSQSAGCYKIIPVNLEVRNPTATISGILNVCSGSTELKASSGATYSWSTGEITQNINVTSIGVYTVTVTDSFGCSSTATVNIEPSQTAVTPTLEITQPSCFVSTGTIKVTSPASEYSFDNGTTWVTNAIKTNLYPGDYSVMIKTVKGCTSYAQDVTIKQSLLPYPYYDAIQPKFCGDTGTITITSPAASYSYDNGLTWVNDSVLTNLGPGLYTIRTKDAAGCISNPQGVVITSVTLGRPDFTVINPACTVSGKITINTSADFYTFNGGQTWVTTNVLDNVFSGSFSIGIKNNLGCTSYLESISLQTFQTIYPYAETIQPSCGENGTIYISSESDFYSFDNGITWTTSNTKDLPPGNYSIKLKNAAGCLSRSQIVTLYEPRLPQPFVTAVQPTCGVDGTITINTVSDFYSFDNGATWVTTNTQTSAAGSYQVKVKNSIGCMSDPQYITLYPPKIQTPNVTLVQPTCNVKGSLTVTTVSDFYSINGGQTWSTSNVFSNLAGSNYGVMIKNNLGCASEINYVYFNQVYLAEPTYTAVNPSCGNVGNITFTSTADFYSIDGGYTWSTSPVFNNLIENYYSLMVKNSTNCKSSGISLYMNITNLATPTAIVVQPTCGTTGSITITSPGTSFSINGGNSWSASPIFNNLQPNYYYILVKNATCTSTSASVNIQPFYLPNPDYTFTHPTCGVGGTITITTPAAQYSINNGQTWSASPTFTNLADGYYNVMVQNAAGCKSYSYGSSLSLKKFYLPKPNISIIQPTCTVKGSIKIMTSASAYSFDAGQTWSTVNERINLTSGNYNVMIRNAQGCTSESMYISMTAFYLPRPFVKTVQPSCGDGGSITVVSQAALYSFDNGTTWVTSPSLLNPTPGYYQILIKNSAGCTSQSAYTSISKFLLSAPSFTVIQPTCSAPKGSIFINTIADLYSFDNGVTWTSNPVKNNLNSGSYNLLVKNSAGCTSQSAYANIYSAPNIPPTPAFTVTQPSACDATDGTITITTLGKSYSFNDGASWSTNPIKQNIGAGTYVLKIKTNSSTCESISVPVTLDSGINIAAPTISVTQPTCSVSTGSITVTTSAATYSFDDGLTFVYADTKTNLVPGVYKIKIKNAAGCVSYSVSATVTTPAPLPSPAFVISQPDCAVALGSIKITTVAAEYSFDNGITYGTSDTKSNLSAATYNLMIKDSFGCYSLAGIATVIQQPITPTAPQISVTQSSGCTNSIGTVAVISAAAFYSFDDGATWVTTSSSNLSPGTYKIRIKLSTSGCSSPSTIATIDPPLNAPSLPLFTIAQPSSCVNPFGNITITSTENQYSFDGGISYSSSATSSSLSPGTYLLKVKNSAGCESGSVSVTITVPADTPRKPTANVTQIDCSTAFGKIIINENAAQYSIDDGLSWQNSNTFSALLPNTYSIKIKSNLGCISVPTTVVVNTFINPTPKPIVNAIQHFCVQQNSTIANIAATGESLQWYSAANSTIPLALNNPLINGNTYFVTQTKNSCESERALVKITIIATPSPTADPLQEFCISQAAALSNLIVNGSQIKWYSSTSGNTVLPNTTKLQDGVTYFASQTAQGCESVQRIPVTVSLVMTNIPATDFVAPALCSDENGTKKIDLTTYQSNVVVNAQNYTYEFFDQNNNVISDFKNYKLQTGQNILFVKVNSPVGCFARVTLSINLNASPVVNVPATAEYCPEEIVKLDAGNQPSSSSFAWTFNGNAFSDKQTIDAKNSGNYQITVTSILGCTTTKTVVVKKVDLPVITDIKIENSTVQIIATGAGMLEYSIDGISWTSSNVFYNVPSGNYLAYVRSGLRPCAFATRPFTIFKIVNAFTPDSDGINDQWKIEGIENYPGSKIKVIDRFGTVVLDKTVNGVFSWNGEFASRKLPTGNYWYQIVLSDNRILSGYVMIKNRN